MHHQTSTSSGIFSTTCIFCNSERKTVSQTIEYVGNCKTRDAEKAIKDAAVRLEDSCLLAKIGNIDFIAKEVKYHHSCRKIYLQKSQRVQVSAEDKSDYSESRDNHLRAFFILTDYLQDKVLTDNRAEFMTSIHAR